MMAGAEGISTPLRLAPQGTHGSIRDRHGSNLSE